MSKLLSVLALSGNADAAILQAADDVRANIIQVVLHGNARNIMDTLQALREAGAVTKAGIVAKSRKGAILSCLVQAHDEGTTARNTFQTAHTGHKGRPTADMTYQAGVAADRIALAFEERARIAIAPKAKAPAEAKAEPKADAPVQPEAEADAPVGMGKAVAASVLVAERARTARRIKALRATVRTIRQVNRMLADEVAELRAELAAATMPKSPAKRLKRAA